MSRSAILKMLTSLESYTHSSTAAHASSTAHTAVTTAHAVRFLSVTRTLHHLSVFTSFFAGSLFGRFLFFFSHRLFFRGLYVYRTETEITAVDILNIIVGNMFLLSFGICRIFPSDRIKFLCAFFWAFIKDNDTCRMLFSQFVLYIITELIRIVVPA